MSKTSKLVTAALVVALCSIDAPARANGSLDSNFATAGTFRLDNALPANVTINAIKMQGSKIIFAGKKDDFLIVGRINSNGTLDPSFATLAATPGIFELVNSGTQDQATDLYVSSSDGSIFVAGEQGLGVVLFKLTSDGVLDPTFNSTGIQSLPYTYVSCTRYLTNPVISAGVGESEIFLTAIRWKTDCGSNLLASPFRVFSIKFDNTGHPDSDFRDNVIASDLEGYVSTSEFINGSIYIGGNHFDGSTTLAQIVSFNSTGDLNLSFNGTGILNFTPNSSMTTSPGNWSVQLTDIALDTNGQILLAGSVMDAIDATQIPETYVYRIADDGQTLDFVSISEPGSMHLFSTQPKMEILPDRKVLVLTEYWEATPDPSVNQQTSRLFRLSSDLSLDGTFGTSGFYDYANLQNLRAITIQSDNKIIVGGSYTDNSTSSFLVIRQKSATVADSPTIGTATATGSTTATVSFTAPVSNGGATITGYTATSSPGGFTGTLAGASAGTITVTGLSASTEYRFSVTATNSEGVSIASSASNSITTSAASSGGTGGGGTTTSTTAADELRRQQEAAQAAKQNKTKN